MGDTKSTFCPNKRAPKNIAIHRSFLIGLSGALSLFKGDERNVASRCVNELVAHGLDELKAVFDWICLQYLSLIRWTTHATVKHRQP